MQCAHTLSLPACIRKRNRYVPGCGFTQATESQSDTPVTIHFATEGPVASFVFFDLRVLRIYALESRALLSH